MLFFILIDAYFLQNVVTASENDLMTRIISCLKPSVQKIPPQNYQFPSWGDSPSIYCYLGNPANVIKINFPLSIFPQRKGLKELASHLFQRKF